MKFCNNEIGKYESLKLCIIKMSKSFEISFFFFSNVIYLKKLIHVHLNTAYFDSPKIGNYLFIYIHDVILRI